MINPTSTNVRLVKLQFTAIMFFALGLAYAQAQERTEKFDADAAKRTLSGEVARTPGRFVTKGLGGDPITKRFYSKNAVVVTRQSGATETHPFVEVPLLFVVNTDELRKDDASRENVGKVARMLKELAAQKATFAIEGHASAEGNPARNRELSNLRALRIQELLRAKGVPAEVLARTEGFGSDHAQFSAKADEPQLAKDRRVLVVKE